MGRNRRGDRTITVKKMTPYWTYVDMDGVIADFFGALAKEFGVQHWKDIPTQEDVIERLKKEKDLITNIKDYKYKIQKQFIFEDDLENGFSTLVYLVNNKNELQNFQENLLNTFIPEVRSDFTKLNNQYKNDFLEKNYPFIGSKYIPHFTITNIEKLSNSEKEQFLNKSVTIFEKLKQLVVGEIFDDEIKVLEKLW